MLLKNKLDIEKWLDKYNINNYELISDEEYGYVVNVSGNVNLNKKRLKSIDVKFNIVDGDFKCNQNELTSLYGSPRKTGNFSCSNNQLETLLYGPEFVDGNFHCGENKLISFEGCPQIIKGAFICNNNKLTINGLLYLFKNDKFVDLKINYIYFAGNKELNNLEFIENYEEIKKYLIILKQKNELIHNINSIDKSVEKINKL